MLNTQVVAVDLCYFTCANDAKKLFFFAVKIAVYAANAVANLMFLYC